MKTLPKTPKMLPWLARKAGISDIRAEALWHDAERWAGAAGHAGSADYFKLAVDRLLQLVGRGITCVPTPPLWLAAMGTRPVASLGRVDAGDARGLGAQRARLDPVRLDKPPGQQLPG
jgi:hypothetical protein